MSELSVFNIVDDTPSNTHKNINLKLNIDGDENYCEDLFDISQAKGCKLNLLIKNVRCGNMVLGQYTPDVSGASPVEENEDNVVDVNLNENNEVNDNLSEINKSYVKGNLNVLEGSKVFENCSNIVVNGLVNKVCTLASYEEINE